MAIVGGRAILFQEDEEFSRHVRSIEEMPPPSLVNLTQRLRRHNPLTHSSIAMRRTWLDKVRGYDERLSRHVDYDLYVRIAALGGQLRGLDMPVVGKRIHPDQAFQGRRVFRYRLSSLAVQARALRDLDGPPADALFLLARGLVTPMSLQSTRRLGVRTSQDTVGRLARHQSCAYSERQA